MSTPFRVVIVGGGTAGWMTAAYLAKAFSRNVQIQVVESKAIGRIGVGEATFSTLRLFFEFLDLAESDWMPHCSATYKLAIKFVDWNAARRHFYHPFQRYGVVRGHSTAEWWLKLCGQEPFDYTCFCVPTLCDAQRSPRFADGRCFDDNYEAHVGSDTPKATVLQNLQIQYPYAYHFDAQLVADFLCGYAQRRGVTRVIDDVLEVRQADNGFITAVVTRNHGPVEGDLFVDCTGFRGLLINQTLGEPFLPFARSLLCDRAVATQVPIDVERDGIRPYTTATALSSGWVWDIPLFGRKGTGYVYSSAFLSPDAAEAEFRRHLGPDADRSRFSHIQMRVGRNRNSWVKNCVAIGLSSGFVEPLESTGIFFIQHGIEELVNNFCLRAFNDECIKSYNRAIANCIDGVLEFLTLHYFASTRADTAFWKATKRDIVVPEELGERLRLWRMRLPTNKTINPNYHGFESYSYSVMLLGLGHRPTMSLPALDAMDDREAWMTFDANRHRARRLAAALPSQYEYLRGVFAATQTTPRSYAHLAT